ncbi:hypothetical protein [Roseospira visakhapatnamensis]|uniref:Uncharacterized protein n=1 Tax=Roseospira visakhapatnamensis TaxID=390880 RepID=A0A7W6RFI4_9PROT|nr:hypothetical protein [Roseospira visakhapatnamensis]MBB4267074.1 hypothetical protein [Roseospira visakhapatnamensis]
MRGLLIAGLVTATLALPAAAAEPAPPPADGSSPAAVASQPRQEPGYRLEGNTLHFPGGGTHAIRDTDRETAEKLLRDAYGLVGPRDALVRTRW